MIKTHSVELKFTPLEFETKINASIKDCYKKLKFTPLEFETFRIWC